MQKNVSFTNSHHSMSCDPIDILFSGSAQSIRRDIRNYVKKLDDARRDVETNFTAHFFIADSHVEYDVNNGWSDR